MARRFEFYKVKRGDNLADPAFLNKRFEDIDLRMAAREGDLATINAALEEVETLAINRINDVFLPLIEEAKARLDNYGVSFTAASGTTFELPASVPPSTTEFTLTEETRQAYYYTDYVAIRAILDETKYVIARVVSYVRATGVLTVQIEQIVGTGTFSSWSIHTGVMPDVSHATRVDNPHEVTASQTGAYTDDQTDAAIAAAIAAIPGVDLSSRLEKAQNLADLPNADTARTNLGLGGLATANSVGYGQVASNVWATVANFRTGAAQKALQADVVFSAMAYVTLTDAATIAVDLNTGFNFTVSLTTSRILGFPTNPKVGQSGFIDIVQPGGGNAWLTFASGYTFDGGNPPSIDIVGNRVTSLYYHVRSVTEVRIGLAFRGVR